MTGEVTLSPDSQKSLRAVRLGSFLVHARMARGGMADLFLGTRQCADSSFEPVVIKRIRREFCEDTAFVRMFHDEARISRLLQHPNIAQVFEVGGTEGSAFLVMEFIAGVNLKILLEKGSLVPALAVAVAAGVARGLHAAHEQHDTDGKPLAIVHRDVTPMNIMIPFDGVVKLLDFGIALARGRAERTKKGVLKGKWSYLSPEQIVGKAVDRRADIFTLGTVLYEMLAGQRAFQGSAPVELLRRISAQDPCPLTSLLPDLPVNLEKIVFRCLKKDPYERFQTAAELADALDDIASQLHVRSEDFTALLAAKMQSSFSERLQATRQIVERIISLSTETMLEQTTTQKPLPTLTQENEEALRAANIDGDDDTTENEPSTFSGPTLFYEGPPTGATPPTILDEEAPDAGALPPNEIQEKERPGGSSDRPLQSPAWKKKRGSPVAPLLRALLLGIIVGGLCALMVWGWCTP